MKHFTTLQRRVLNEQSFSTFALTKTKQHMFRIRVAQIGILLFVLCAFIPPVFATYLRDDFFTVCAPILSICFMFLAVECIFLVQKEADELIRPRIEAYCDQYYHRGVRGSASLSDVIFFFSCEMENANNVEQFASAKSIRKDLLRITNGIHLEKTLNSLHH